MDDTLVLIPAYQPTENLTELAGSLYAVGFRIVVVDDGSGDEFSHIFEKTEAYATVIGYEKNHGKGYALKYGLSFIAKQMAYFKYLITVDSDGQHTEDAVKKISDEIHRHGDIVIAQRDPNKCNVSATAKLCNKLIRAVFGILSGRYIRDTMSGLRAFEFKKYLDWLSEIPGDGFDYETATLLDAAKRRYPIRTIKIEECEWQQPKHESSHYRAFSDTFLQLKALLRGGFPSVLATLINYILVLILVPVFGSGFAGVAGAVMLANAVGISLSVYLNNRIGYEENYDGALSYNRILIGMLRFFAYFLFMEILCALIKIGPFLSLLISALLVESLELKIMSAGLDKELRILPN